MLKFRDLHQELHCEEEETFLDYVAFSYSIIPCYGSSPHYQHKNTQDDWKVNMMVRKALTGWSHAVILSESQDYDGRHCPKSFFCKVNTGQIVIKFIYTTHSYLLVMQLPKWISLKILCKKKKKLNKTDVCVSSLRPMLQLYLVTCQPKKVSIFQ